MRLVKGVLTAGQVRTRGALGAAAPMPCRTEHTRKKQILGVTEKQSKHNIDTVRNATVQCFRYQKKKKRLVSRAVNKQNVMRVATLSGGTVNKTHIFLKTPWYTTILLSQKQAVRKRNIPLHVSRNLSASELVTPDCAAIGGI